MTGINKWVNHLTKNHVSIFPLLVFRIIFGIMMFFSTLRFALKGWIYDLVFSLAFGFFQFKGWSNHLERNANPKILMLEILTKL